MLVKAIETDATMALEKYLTKPDFWLSKVSDTDANAGVSRVWDGRNSMDTYREGQGTL